MTIQFQATSHRGPGNLRKSLDQKQSDNHNQLAVVRVTYVLNCEVTHPNTPPAPEGQIGHNGHKPQFAGNEKIGSQAKSGNIFGIIGAFGLHQKIWNAPGERRSLLNGIGRHHPHIFLPNLNH